MIKLLLIILLLPIICFGQSNYVKEFNDAYAIFSATENEPITWKKYSKILHKKNYYIAYYKDSIDLFKGEKNLRLKARFKNPYFVIDSIATGIGNYNLIQVHSNNKMILYDSTGPLTNLCDYAAIHNDFKIEINNGFLHLDHPNYQNKIKLEKGIKFFNNNKLTKEKYGIDADYFLVLKNKILLFYKNSIIDTAHINLKKNTYLTGEKNVELKNSITNVEIIVINDSIVMLNNNEPEKYGVWKDSITDLISEYGDPIYYEDEYGMPTQNREYKPPHFRCGIFNYKNQSWIAKPTYYNSRKVKDKIVLISYRSEYDKNYTFIDLKNLKFSQKINSIDILEDTTYTSKLIDRLNLKNIKRVNEFRPYFYFDSNNKRGIVNIETGEFVYDSLDYIQYINYDNFYIHKDSLVFANKLKIKLDKRTDIFSTKRDTIIFTSKDKYFFNRKFKPIEKKHYRGNLNRSIAYSKDKYHRYTNLSIKSLNDSILIIEYWKNKEILEPSKYDSIIGFTEYDEPVYAKDGQGNILYTIVPNISEGFGNSAVYNYKTKKFIIKPNYKHTWIDFKNNKFYVGQANKPENFFLVYDINGKLID